MNIVLRGKGLGEEVLEFGEYEVLEFGEYEVLEFICCCCATACRWKYKPIGWNCYHYCYHKYNGCCKQSFSHWGNCGLFIKFIPMHEIDGFITTVDQTVLQEYRSISYQEGLGSLNKRHFQLLFT